MKIAVARAKVEIVCRDAAPVFQPGQNGWTAAWGGAERARMRLAELISRALNREQAKGENQNERFVEECSQRNASYEQEWNVLNAETRPLLESRLEKSVVKRVTELRGEVEALVKEAGEHREKWEAEVKATAEFAR